MWIFKQVFFGGAFCESKGFFSFFCIFTPPKIWLKYRQNRGEFEVFLGGGCVGFTGNINAGRRKVPLEKQKNRLSNARKEKRKAAAPVALGAASLGPVPPEVQLEPVALAKWLVLKKLYNGKAFVTSSDRTAISRYCLLCAEEELLRTQLHDQIAAGFDMKDVLAINRALDTKRSLIRSYEDRLYLNPLAKMRGLPPASPPTKDELADAGFEGV
jgi:hypothetical protein